MEAQGSHMECEESLGSSRFMREVKSHMGGEYSPYLLQINPHNSSKGVFTLASQDRHKREDNSFDEQVVA